MLACGYYDRLKVAISAQNLSWLAIYLRAPTGMKTLGDDEYLLRRCMRGDRNVSGPVHVSDCMTGRVAWLIQNAVK